MGGWPHDVNLPPTATTTQWVTIPTLTPPPASSSASSSSVLRFHSFRSHNYSGPTLKAGKSLPHPTGMFSATAAIIKRFTDCTNEPSRICGNNATFHTIHPTPPSPADVVTASDAVAVAAALPPLQNPPILLRESLLVVLLSFHFIFFLPHNPTTLLLLFPAASHVHIHALRNPHQIQLPPTPNVYLYRLYIYVFILLLCESDSWHLRTFRQPTINEL